MKRFSGKVIFNTLAFYLAVFLFPVIHAGSVFSPFWAGVVLAIIQITLRPILVIILSPFIFLTAGLLTLVINTWMVMLSALIVQIKISGFWLNLAVAILVTVLNLCANKALKSK